MTRSHNEYIPGHSKGFTFVELLLVISILSIVIAITAVGWGSVAQSSRDRTREQDVRQWVSTFDLYKSRYIVWPALPVNDLTPKQLCLGAPLSPNNRCVQYGNSAKSLSASGADYASLKLEVEKVSDFPKNSGPVTRDIAAGPFVRLEQQTVGGTITVTGKFIGFFEGSCPSGFADARSDSTLFSSLPTNVTPCKVSPEPKFSYTPSP